MASSEDLHTCYMQVAEAHAALSKGLRAKVGACLVTANGVILGGCNGLAPGGDNMLEYETTDGLVTKPEVIHAELNCILKAAREGVSVLGSTLYTTLSPCVPCAEMLLAAGVQRVYYRDAYRCSRGIDRLNQRAILVQQLSLLKTLD